MFPYPMLFAQEVVATAGNTLSNANGTMSYTLGEVVANTLTIGDKTITQGFHQSMLSVSIESQIKDLDFSINAFPNPVTTTLTLRIGKENVLGLIYSLYDLGGKLLDQKNLLNAETAIPFDQLKSGTYIINIHEGSKTLKTFKIIKQIAK